MIRRNEFDAQARVIEILLESLPALRAVYVFGTAGTPYMRADSDLDLAFLGEHAEDPVRVWNLAQRIAGLVGRDVDLVDLRGASTVMAAQVVSDGRRLFCADEDYCAAFEAHAVADYARLNEERREILADIRARGSIYG